MGYISTLIGTVCESETRCFRGDSDRILATHGCSPLILQHGQFTFSHFILTCYPKPPHESLRARPLTSTFLPPKGHKKTNRISRFWLLPPDERSIVGPKEEKMPIIYPNGTIQSNAMDDREAKFMYHINYSQAGWHSKFRTPSLGLFLICHYASFARALLYVTSFPLIAEMRDFPFPPMLENWQTFRRTTINPL